MKRKIICISLILTMILCSAGMAAGIVEPSMISVKLPNDGSDNQTIIVDYTGEKDVWRYCEDWLSAEWGTKLSDTDTSKKQELYISPVSGGYCGNTYVFLKAEAPDATASWKMIKVFVWDNTKVNIQNVKQKNGLLTIKWGYASAWYYQLQYRKTSGSWKTSWKTLASLAEYNEYTMGNLAKGVTYQFRVRPLTPSQEWGMQKGPWSAIYSYTIK